MCFVHDKDWTTWPAMMKTVVSYIVAYAPHDVCSSRVAKCRWRRATTVPSSHVSGCLLCISGSPKRYYGAPRAALPRLAVWSGGES